MFTGLIEATAGVLALDKGQLQLERPADFTDSKLGSSIAVSGVCLTIVELDDRSMSFQMVEETLKRSKLGSLKVGDRVNLERAMKADARLEGHKVQGHVEGVGKVISSVASIPQPLPPEEEGERQRRHPLNRMIKAFARSMRRNPTDAEAVLWQAIRYDQLGVRFRRQYHHSASIFDFYCPSLHLAIEVDGSIHKENFQLNEDVSRDEYFKKDFDITTLRFTNDDVLKDLENVLKRIKESIRKFPSSTGGGARGGGQEGLGTLLTLELPNDLVPFIIPKGSITLDGVSLTIANIEGNRCTVALIPHTLAHTTLGTLKTGDHLNIETDMMVRAFAQFSRPGIA